MKKHLVQTGGTAILAMLLACSAPSKADKQETARTTEKTAQEDDWMVLFDGTSTAGWRGFNIDTLPPNWMIEDGALKSLGEGGDIGGDIVYGDREFDNFELQLEWKIGEGGNSGIFYHVVEGEKYKAPYETAPEYQLLDNLGYPDSLKGWQQVGADYAMYNASYAENTVKPAGEWNASRIVYTPDLAQYWLNGDKMLEFVPYSAEWMERRNSGKWDEYPDYAMAKTGLIGIQDHGSPIWFKNIKIKPL